MGRIRLVKGEDTRSNVGQLIKMGISFLDKGFTPLECYLYQFYKKAKSTDGYVSSRWIEKVFRPKLNSLPFVRIVKNKLVFYYYYNRRKLPVVKVFGFFHPTRGFTARRGNLRNIADLKKLLTSIKAKRIVAKPSCTLGGKGMMLVESLRSDKLFDVYEEREITLDDFFDQMLADITIRQPREDSCTGYLLQEYLSPHPLMNPLKGKALNTVRIATLRDASGAVHPDFAMIRIGKPTSVTDNLHKGGVVAGVDLETGRISQAIYGYEQDKGPWVEKKNLDIGSLFKQRKIPQWERMVETVQRFHDTTPGINSIGWDVALSRDGPVVVEGNDNWDMVIAQIIDGGYLTPRRREIFSGYGLRLPHR